ncbi:PREDICTED: uncharacterized protein LOC105951519 [Erythranthe guttata]|uniref:uncharacterized protein LOC105951519 n=1 Tax=Erythranthe guttata TaxID=4155 RepID=UPI00064D8DED|nr:PREDICTED: uncharacterized protein LOC105951519 [Erythranthe guttata]|eukprot:XP_012830429.1 PREDICTED: uncharacterized protein LOC105951519 [Erythranthe guttata]
MKWNDIHPDKLVLQYLAPRERMFVTLTSDEDVVNMVTLHLVMHMSVVDIMVIRTDELDGRRRRTPSNGESVSSNSPLQIEYNPVGDSIDAWRHCIRGENQIFKDANDFRFMLKIYCIANNRTFKYKKNDQQKIIAVCIVGLVLKIYCIANNRTFKYKKNDQQKIIAVCIVENCKWRVYASVHKSDKLFGIRKCILEHSCGDATLRTRGHPKADATWISQLMKQKLRDEPGYKPIAILNEVQRKYGVELKYYTAWRGKEKAMYDIHGDESSCYDKLRRYCRALKQNNPGSCADYEIDPQTQKFLRIFISFGNSILGFHRGCRQMICLDGTHIKNKYKGCLLSVVSKDPNDELYTLAYAIVDAENDRNWEWFCNKLKEIPVYHNGGLLKNYTIFSDRHSGLIKAIPLVFPGSNHAYLLRHLEDNFRIKVLRSYPLHNKAYWVSVLHKAAIAPTRQEFEEHISHIVQSMPRAESFIRDSDPNRWANAYFSGDRWGIMNSNQVECWNGWVKDERSLPVPSMIDMIRIKIMKMIGNRREDSLVMAGTVCPRVEKRLLINYTASRLLKYTRSSGTRYEVYEEDKSYGVDLETRTCTCKSWQLDKLPCKHACACIESKGYSVFEFVDPCFRVDLYKEVYKYTINPIPSFDEEFDLYNAQTNHGPEDVFINPPASKAQPGRRRTKRIPSQVETRATKCARCGKPGHNRRTCKQPVP